MKNYGAPGRNGKSVSYNKGYRKRGTRSVARDRKSFNYLLKTKLK